MLCPHCETAYVPGDRFCSHCGTALPSLSSVAASAPYRWDSACMDAKDITWFSLSFGDLPILNIDFDGTRLTTQRFINGSRDGWMSFPKGYFDKEEHALSADEIERLRAVLASTDFSVFSTSEHTLRSMYGVGFCASEKFSCEFSNGVCFQCLLPETEEFRKLVDRVTAFLKPAHAAPSAEISQTTPPKETTVPAVITACCKQTVPTTMSYCPHCGSTIDDANILETTTMIFDFEETSWLCDKCRESNAVAHPFCGYCGQKRPW